MPEKILKTRSITTRPDGTVCVKRLLSDESIVQQQFKDEVDINNIMDKFQKGLPITHVNRAQGHYSDLTEIPSTYEGMLNQSIKAGASFEALPEKIKRRFGTPEALLAFLDDPSNAGEAVTLGLVDNPPSAQRDDKPNDNATMPRRKKSTPTNPPSEPETID